MSEEVAGGREGGRSEGQEGGREEEGGAGGREGGGVRGRREPTSWSHGLSLPCYRCEADAYRTDLCTVQ